ncbi:MAG: LytTR family transcriptional regulator [Clostridia bacterium]|nr:LytTR family transcriptional regulator [Clostridia bacterium]
MEIKINTNISEEFSNITININAPKMTEEVENIIRQISNINSIPNQVIGYINNEIYFIELKDIICFFSKDKYVFARTKENSYKIKYKLYELNEIFEQKDFIRISNSCIININKIECFDTSIIGTITVKMKDGTKEIVSKRNVSQIMKLLKQRGNLK